jgi:hypothetical protein
MMRIPKMGKATFPKIGKNLKSQKIGKRFRVEKESGKVYFQKKGDGMP